MPNFSIKELRERSAEAKRQFKSGDRVICIDNTETGLLERYTLEEGKEYVIVGAYNDQVRIVGSKKFFYAGRFDLIIESKPTEKVKARFSVFNITGGKEYLVYAHPAAEIIIIIDDKGEKVDYHEHHFESMVKSTPAPFKKGDMVRCSVENTASITMGVLYEVLDYTQYMNSIRLKNDHGSIFDYDAKRFVLMIKQESNMVKPVTKKTNDRNPIDQAFIDDRIKANRQAAKPLSTQPLKTVSVCFETPADIKAEEERQKAIDEYVMAEGALARAIKMTEIYTKINGDKWVTIFNKKPGYYSIPLCKDAVRIAREKLKKF